MQETQETQVQPLLWEDPLEKEMANHSIIIAWRIPWTEKPGGLQSKGSQRFGQDCVTEQHQDKTFSRNGSTAVKIPKRGARLRTPLWKK